MSPMPIHRQPVDREFIDSKMGGQLDHEAYLVQHDRPEKKRLPHRIMKMAATTLAIAGVAVVGVRLIGRGVDQINNQYYSGHGPVATQVHSANRSP